jgi:TolA-binding protein
LFGFLLFKQTAALKIKRFYTFCIALLMLGVGVSINSCSTKRNTALARGYHNLTSHYNVYWNGDQNLLEAVHFLKENVKDNYARILRVYNYGDKAFGRQMASHVERTIKKAALAIQDHSMVFGKKEKVKWVEASYLMMGQAFFYKHDFTSARRVFDFIQKKYHYSPIHYLGTLWLAKTYIETHQFGKAEAVLNLLTSQQSEKEFPDMVKNTLPLVYADLYLAMGKPSAAYPYLEKSIAVTHDKDLLSRVYFILGQINRQEGHLSDAADYFRKVIKRNPPFQMDFEARLYLAKSYEASASDSKYIMKTLQKMARKNLYHDYLDQIYYAMAEVAEKNHNDSLMTHYLRLSVSHSKSNSFQKGISSLKLANFYFLHGNYVPSQAYYDTAVQFLPNTYPQYASIRNKSLVLSQLVQQLSVIHKQDSLQRLARMDTAALYAFIDKKIAAYQQHKKEAKKEAEARAEVRASGQLAGKSTFPGPVSGVGGGWYFYNPTALSRGYSEFRRVWGDRKLEDLWFLSDKHTVMANAGVSAENAAPVSLSKKKTTAAAKLTGPETRDFYLKELPKTRADFHRSDSLIEASYSKLGFLYLEELKDTTDALKTYLALQKRYPENPYRLQNWYHLYKIYSGLKQADKAVHYKNLILQNYAGSLYAKVLNNPDYYKKLELAHQQAENLYSRTYNAFEHRQYYRVITYAGRAMKQYSQDTITMPKFLFLQALSLGKVEEPDTLYKALQQFITRYPHHALVARAQAIIKTLQLEYGIGISEAERQAMLAALKHKKYSGSYVYNGSSPQFVLLLSRRKQVNARALETRLSDFNQKYFRRIPLQTNSLALNNQYNLILIKLFDNAQQARQYYDKLIHDPYVFSGIQQQNYRLFIISKENYPLFYKQKDIQGYQQFFKTYYLAP